VYRGHLQRPLLYDNKTHHVSQSTGFTFIQRSGGPETPRLQPLDTPTPYSPGELPIAVMKYKIIYADPPWSFRNYGYEDAVRGCRKEYPTMSVDELCAMPVSEMADNDCILFLWACWPLLPEAFKVIKAWGFTYKTLGFNWVKRNKSDAGFFFGMGNFTRSNSEPCLLAIKGSPKRLNAGISQLHFEPETVLENIAHHSKKPDSIRDKIVELMGELPRIELFARNKTKGWDVWGNDPSVQTETLTL